jgi:hypothetical protein
MLASDGERKEDMEIGRKICYNRSKQLTTMESYLMFLWGIIYLNINLREILIQDI